MWYSLLIGFFLLLMSAVIGMEVATAHNSVIITYNHWVIECSLWVALLATLSLFIGLYVVFHVIGKSRQLKTRYRTWRSKKRLQHVHACFEKGLYQLAAGDWSLAEKTWVKTAKCSPKSLLAYLGAAYAAQAQKSNTQRDLYLQQARALGHSLDKKSCRAIGLIEAQLYIKNQEWEKAQKILEYLRYRFPKHVYIIELLFTVEYKSKNWIACYRLLPVIKKCKVFNAAQYMQYAQSIYLECLDIARDKSLPILIAYWKSLPRQCRQSQIYVVAYIKALMHYHPDALAIKIVNALRCKMGAPDNL